MERRGHFYNRWILVSSSWRQIGHKFSLVIWRLWKLPLLGSALSRECHKKILIFLEMQREHRHFHKLSCWLELEPLLIRLNSRVAKYALLTVNLPCSVKAQMSLCSCLFCPMGILKVNLLLSSQNIWEISLEFYSFPEINSLTLTFMGRSYWDNWTSKEWGMGSHLSPHMWIFSLLPTLHRNASLRTFRATRRLFQSELWPLGFVSMIFQHLQYFSLRIVATRDKGYISNHHSCFIISALLKYFKFLNPILPFDL